MGKGNAGNEVKVAPLLNKLSDVTLTKCGSDQLPSSTQIRKRPRDQGTKQKDWPEKRHKLLPVQKEAESTPSSKDHWTPNSVMIEEKNPEALAKKIVEQGRSYDKPQDMPAPPPVEVRKIDSFHPSRAVPNVQPRAFDACSNPQVPSSLNAAQGPSARGPLIPPPQMAHSSQPYAAGSYRGPPAAPVSMPKMEDFGAAFSNAARSASGAPPPSQPHGESLVLPPHPDSRSHSSEQTAEDMSFASTKVSSTPRAEQFEDRLKTIIHSVLTGDGDQKVQQRQQQQESKPLHIMPPKSPTPSQQGTSMKPMFSPVKKELPTHLPPPPTGIIGSESGPSSSRQQQPITSSSTYPHGPEGNRSMSPAKRATGQPIPPPPSSTGYYSRQNIGQGMMRSMGNPDMGRMGNDYNRQHRYDDDGSAREYSQMRSGPPMHGPPKAAHSSSMVSRHPSVSIQPSNSSTGMARMSQVIEDSIRGHIEAASRPVGPGGDVPKSPSSAFDGDKDEVTIKRSTSEGYPMGPRGYQPLNGKDRRDYMPGAPKMTPHLPYSDWGHPNMPPEAHSSSDSHRNYMEPCGPFDARPSNSQSMHHPRKRMSITEQQPPHTMQLPPKKQHLDGGMGAGDYNQGPPPSARGQRLSGDIVDETNQKWQEEVSTGFDRLVAYATEVDRRRKSSGSTTPEGFADNRSGSPKTKRPPSKASPSASSSTSGYDRMSALSMKFKRAPSGFRDGLPQRNSLPTRSPSSMVRLAASSIPHDHDFLAHSGQEKTRQQLPGENLPEHHFKKRYFANQNKDLDDIPTSKKPESLVTKKRPSLLGGPRPSASSSKEENSEQDGSLASSRTAENNSSKQ